MVWPFGKKTPPLSLQQVAAKHRAELLAGEAKTVAQMQRYWSQVEKTLDRRLAAVLKKIAAAQKAGLPPSPAWIYQQARYQEYIAAVHAESAAFANQAAALVVAQKKASIGIGETHALAAMKAAGIDGSFNLFPREALIAMAGHLADGSPLKELFQSFGGVLGRKLSDTLVTEFVAGRGPREIARKMRQAGLQEGRRALVIARTESMRAYRTATLQNYRANSDVVTGWRWMSAQDRRTCPACLAMDGSEHPLTEDMESHPSCRCAAMPLSTYRKTVRASGEDYLLTLSEEEQRATLGPGLFRKWKEGIPLKEMVAKTSHPRWGGGIRIKRLAQIVKPSQWTDAERILGTQVGNQLGSNAGGVWEGKDGIKRYVKEYSDPTQAWAEKVANAVYRELGAIVPDTEVFESGGKVLTSLRWIEVDAQLGLKPTADQAAKFLDGFVADVLTANWDVVGLAGDNSAILGSNIVRIDQGGSLLFRAKAGRKAASTLKSISEWDGFSSGTNPAYKSIFKAAKVSRAEEIQSLDAQIDALETARARLGSWAALVEREAGAMAEADKKAIAEMLEWRHSAIVAKRASIAKARDLDKVKAGFLQIRSQGEADSFFGRHKYGRLAQETRDALKRYTGSYYSTVNGELRRSNLAAATRDAVEAMDKDFAVPLVDDLILERGTTIPPDQVEAFLKGELFEDKGYMSTTVLSGRSFGGSFKVRILVRKGSKIGPVGHFSSHKSELEVLLPRNSKLRYIATDSDGFYVCELEQ